MDKGCLRQFSHRWTEVRPRQNSLDGQYDLFAYAVPSHAKAMVLGSADLRHTQYDIVLFDSL